MQAVFQYQSRRTGEANPSANVSRVQTPAVPIVQTSLRFAIPSAGRTALIPPEIGLTPRPVGQCVPDVYKRQLENHGSRVQWK